MLGKDKIRKQAAEPALKNGRVKEREESQKERRRGDGAVEKAISENHHLNELRNNFKGYITTSQQVMKAQ